MNKPWTDEELAAVKMAAKRAEYAVKEFERAADAKKDRVDDFISDLMDAAMKGRRHV